jgi:hypothetical protein
MTLIFASFNGLLVVAPIPGSVTTFSDSDASKEVQLSNLPSGELAGYIELPKRAVITNASFNVTTVPNSNLEYPRDVLVDLGDDGNYEWGFSGDGFGPIGQQNLFRNNRSWTRLQFNGDDHNTTAKFRLPKNATVTSTMMLIDGRANVSGADSSQNWNKLLSQSSSRVAANISDGKIYFARLNQQFFDIYDPITKTWSTSSNCVDPIGRAGHGITVAGPDIYITSQNFSATTREKLYRYHTNNDTWINLGALPITNLALGGLTYNHGNRVYAVQYMWGASSTVSFYYYSISNGTWVKLNSPIRANFLYPTICYYDNRVYLMNKTYEWTNNPAGVDIQFYAPGNNSWFKLSSAPLGINSRLCTDNYNIFGATPEGQVLKYDVLTDTWAITGKKTTNFVRLTGGLAYSDRNFYLCRYNPSNGYYNITATGGGNYPINTTLDIGDNGGLPEWDIVGEFNTTDYVNNFTTELNTLISSSPVSYVDGYGNEFVDITINVTSNVTSEFQIRNMLINYSFTAVVDSNPYSGNLLNSLNALVPDTGEGNISIPIVIYSSLLGSINISNISIDYYIPDLTNDRLELISPHPQFGKIVYADYTNYKFLVNVTNRQGPTDVDSVTLILDLDGENLQVNWSEATDTFSEHRDPMNLIWLDTLNCTSGNNLVDRWTLEFSIKFDWWYANETLELCALNTTNDTGAYIFNVFTDIYQVENDLNFTGTLDVVSTNQGNLSDKTPSLHWVAANETITWSNLTVVYEATTDIYPANKNFNVTVFDDDTDSWVNDSSSGNKCTITSISDPVSDYFDIHSVDITDIPGLGEDISNIQFLVKTDNDGPKKPSNIQCRADSAFDEKKDYDDDTSIYVTWDSIFSLDDYAMGVGSGVDYYAMDFANPAPTTQRSSGESETGSEGLSTFYVRARDKVGNWGVTGSANIFIDNTSLIFSNPTPDPEEWLTNLTVTCGISISDIGGSGVDVDNVQYRYVEDGDIWSGDWHPYNGPGVSGETLVCQQNITFDSDGESKKVAWRAKDLAGIGWVEPESALKLKIDSISPTMDIVQPAEGQWLDTLTPNLKLYINDTSGSGVDANKAEYSISTTGLQGFGTWRSIYGAGGGDSVLYNVEPTFEEGALNYFRVKAFDIAGNEIVFPPFQVHIDVTKPDFDIPEPDSDSWVKNTEVLCNITITDSVSPIDIDTIRYSHSKNGTNDYSYWKYVPVETLVVSPDSKTIKASVTVDFGDGTNNYVRWRVFDVAGNEEFSEDYNVKVDVTPIMFEEPTPTSDEWINSIGWQCSIILNETSGSGVVIETVEYSISRSGPTGFGEWTNKDLKFEELNISPSRQSATETVHSMVQVSVLAQFTEGDYNYIKWRARDLAKNTAESTANRINIDLLEVGFSAAEPREGIIYDALELRCKITVEDFGGSGVDPTSIAYRYSTFGLSDFSLWLSDEITPDKKEDKFVFFVDLPFQTGVLNYIQWRASDNAGNGPTESKAYNININSAPVPFIKEPKENGKYNSNDLIIFDANTTYDPDPDDKLTYGWSSNVSKFLGDTISFRHKLAPGYHTITLTVSDDHGHVESTSKIIYVEKFQQDSDNDNIPDLKDDDDDNDDVPDLSDAFPFDPDEWIDTDSDGVGDNKDNDDDGDTYLDIDDDYPMDPTRWKKDAPADYTIIYLLMTILIVVILIIAFGLISVRRKRRKQKELAEEAEDLASKLPVSVKSTGALYTSKLREAQAKLASDSGASPKLGTGAEQGGAVPLLPGAMPTQTTGVSYEHQTLYPSTTTPTQPTVTEPKAAPQHLVSYPEQMQEIQTVQSYIPQPTQPPEPTQVETPSPSISTPEQPQPQVVPQPQESAQPSPPPVSQPQEPGSTPTISKPGLVPGQQKPDQANSDDEIN